MAPKDKLDIILEDEAVVFVNKPSGLHSIPDRYRPELPNLQQLLKDRYGQIWTVHRLDRDTSGIICFARTDEAHRHLSRQFQERTVRKLYHALTDGHPGRPSGRIEAPIAPHPSRKGQMIIAAQGKEALTYYQVQQHFQHFSLLEVDIRTGRTHQVRVHLASIGCPLMVDPLYGKRDAFFLSELKRKQYNLGKGQEERPLISRTTLHAHSLAFEHPLTGTTTTYQAPLHKDMRALLRQLQKWDQ